MDEIENKKLVKIDDKLTRVSKESAQNTLNGAELQAKVDDEQEIIKSIQEAQEGHQNDLDKDNANILEL